MDSLVSQQTPAQRQVWKRKILELREDANSIRRQGQYYDRMVSANVREQKEREELMTLRHRRGGRGRGDDAENAMNDFTEESES
eukprot:CAMPEP_0197836030 /NCGR_PEP_ID=MMETSP1437-20131217/27702_1 /TAXON_ID=49252 ORGANISM="Eucampia antarctica, Strain CCMP1452" /NCGR_SAMPLE_ID=MMETSP1437 /ASSEMBLY_ACC=CAM_ASM_001096 /LENGTH=83 /DNA_ID=CAMNT_0043441877 /DNA_START=100 /DNA_END=347 /DNA_ORIENTATION=+